MENGTFPQHDTFSLSKREIFPRINQRTSPCISLPIHFIGSQTHPLARGTELPGTNLHQLLQAVHTAIQSKLGISLHGETGNICWVNNLDFNHIHSSNKNVLDVSYVPRVLSGAGV